LGTNEHELKGNMNKGPESFTISVHSRNQWLMVG